MHNNNIMLSIESHEGWHRRRRKAAVVVREEEEEGLTKLISCTSFPPTVNNNTMNNRTNTRIIRRRIRRMHRKQKIPTMMTSGYSGWVVLLLGTLIVATTTLAFQQYHKPYVQHYSMSSFATNRGIEYKVRIRYSDKYSQKLDAYLMFCVFLIAIKEMFVHILCVHFFINGGGGEGISDIKLYCTRLLFERGEGELVIHNIYELSCIFVC